MCEDTKECAMGHCHNQTPSLKKDICEECYHKFQGKLGKRMSTVVKEMIKRAKARGKYEVNITADDIYKVWSKDNRCPIMGTVYEIGGDRNTSPSLDRKDPSKGYTPDNIQVISTLANNMKSNASEKEILQFCKYYLQNFHKQFNDYNNSDQYLKKVGSSKNWHYVRRIPKDLEEHYDKKDKRIVKTTKTSNRLKALLIAVQMNDKLESEWEELRSKHEDNKWIQN